MTVVLTHLFKLLSFPLIAFNVTISKCYQLLEIIDATIELICLSKKLILKHMCFYNPDSAYPTRPRI